MKRSQSGSVLPGAIHFLAAAVLLFVLITGTGPASASGLSPVFTAADMFTERDLLQEVNLAGAEKISVTSGQDVRISAEGVFVLSGAASGTTVYVDAAADEKVQLVLDGLEITNSDFPCIYILSADKVFITTVADSVLTVTGEFRRDGNTKTDGTVFSKQDLVLNGTAALNVISAVNGIVCKDDLKITGGTYAVRAEKKAIEAKNSIRIAGGSFSLSAGTDTLHAENKDDSSLGYIYIGGGVFDIKAGDEGIHAVTVLQIDGGTFSIASEDGMNAAVIRFSSNVQ